jgi:hypothetical protein
MSVLMVIVTMFFLVLVGGVIYTLLIKIECPKCGSTHIDTKTIITDIEIQDYSLYEYYTNEVFANAETKPF